MKTDPIGSHLAGFLMSKVILRLQPHDPVVQLGALKRVHPRYVNVDQVRFDLTLKNGTYWALAQRGMSTKGLNPNIELFRETKHFVEVPRHYKLPLHQTLKVIPLVPKYEKMTLKHVIELRDKVQEEASAALLQDSRDKILSLACGKGKTVVSLHAAATGNRFPLLVVVNTNALMDQWRANYDDSGQLIGGIAKFYGLPESEIGWIQGSKADWRGKKVAIAMLHTLVQKTFPREFYDYWRLVIYDEVHRLGAEHFSRAAPMFPGERWGLSATVERPDGNDLIFRLHLGNVVYKDLEQPLKPKVYFVNTGIFTETSRFAFRRGRVNLAQLTTWLCEHEGRNRLVLNLINRALKEDRTILVLGERLNQLSQLCDECAAPSKAVFIGSMKKDERKEALKARALFASQSLAKEGLDKPALDTLFILIPFGGHGRLQQSLGRILRTYAAGKKDPKCIVFVDNIDIIQALARKMKRALREWEFDFSDVTATKVT